MLIEIKYHLLISIGILLIWSNNFINCENDFEEKPCSILFSENNYAGDRFTFQDYSRAVDLYEELDGASGWNVTGSIHIENSCSMELCTEAYFDGECETLAAGNYNQTDSSFVSASCTCEKECKCSDIYMKKSTCARAYLKNCNTCNARYVDLLGDSEVFVVEYAENVKSLRLRKGCSLTVYDEEEFEGEAQLITEEIVEDYEGKINSYSCTCNDDEFVPRVKPPRPTSYPPLLDIPTSIDGVIEALKNKSQSNHPGLLAAFKSLKSGRSSKNAYILLLGATGAGKSSAVNLLFDNPNVTRTGGGSSTTTDIHEFRIPVSVDELGVANSELRVIDTPGLGDTRGLEQDAKFLATLDAYLSNHEELKDKIPNVILIFNKYNDNRYEGPGSNFVKMLRGFDSFRERITDENYSNVVFVFSHFCSETKGNTRRPEKKISTFKGAIENYSLFPKPILIAVAENKASEYDLPMVNGYYRLPNNEYYPRNLFSKLETVTKNGGDVMGQSVFRSAFRDSDDFNVSSSTFSLVGGSGVKVQNFLRILSSAMLGIDKTEISELLEKVWDNQISSTLRKNFPLSLQYVQKTLNLKNINTKEDIPRTTSEILQMLSGFKQDEATKILLEKGLNVVPPTFQQNTVAGFSYNVFKDSYLPTSPFKIGDLQHSDIGFMIPKSLTCKLEPSSKENIHIFNNMNDYLQHRLKSLGIEGLISKDNFTGIVKPGHNIRELSFKNDSCSITATREFRLFEFVLNDKLDLTPDFKNAVKSLPTFNATDFENVSKWRQFFTDHGTHVVKSVYGGGAIEIQLNSNKPFNDEILHSLFGIIKFAEDMSFLIAPENSNSTDEKITLNDGLNHTLKFLGGDMQYHTNDLTKMSIEEASKLLRNWKKSLKLNPAILTTEMVLMPISQIVKKLGQNISSEIETAASLLFNSELRYTPPKKKPDEVPLSRLDTPEAQALINQNKLLQKSLDTFKLMMEQMEKRNAAERNASIARDAAYKKEREDNNKRHQAAMQELRNQGAADRAVQDKRYNEMKNDFAKEMKALKDSTPKTVTVYRDSAPKIVYRDPTPAPSSGSCIISGTKILMQNFTEKNVENLKVGDLILDKDLNPSRVLGVAKEYLLNENLYGFDKNSDSDGFFTDNHLFVGPSVISKDETICYAKSLDSLHSQNPLMKYVKAAEMGSNVNLFYLENYAKDKHSVAVGNKTVSVFKDEKVYPMDSLVYDIQVDSPSGTYIANGYICRHEIPSFENWPNTMSVLFRLMKTRQFKKLTENEFSVDYVLRMEDVTSDVASKLEIFLSEIDINELENNETQDQSMMRLNDVNVEECISNIFSQPNVATPALKLYAKIGVILSPILDGDSNGYMGLSCETIASLQHKIYAFMINEFQKHV